MWSSLWIMAMMNLAKPPGNAKGAIKFANSNVTYANMWKFIICPMSLINVHFAESITDPALPCFYTKRLNI